MAILLHIGLLFSGLLSAGSAVAGRPEQDLYTLIDARLSVMRDVAAFKWVNDLPVEDLERERVVIEAAVSDGLRKGLMPESSAAFFRVQIEAAKDIQSYWFDRWSESAPPRRAPDLNSEIRPRLIALGSRIVDGMAEPGLRHTAEEFDRLVVVEGLGDDRSRDLLSALVEIRSYSNRLEQILDTGVLRVGTTGDYAPFSFAEDGVPYRGIDIDLAKDMAQSLGVAVTFVATSWPTLLVDLESGAYDIAMSGVTRTLARQRVGFQSEPYFVGGKAPIARCKDAQSFDSLEKIDQPGVKVIVNPGGTNEAYLREYLQHAEVIVHADNRTIFDALERGTADVMITDSIEVELQTRKHPALCRTTADNLTYLEKGYLMPRDIELKAFVDTWLSLRTSDGTVDELFERYLAE